MILIKNSYTQYKSLNYLFFITANSDGDVAGSSSENDDGHRLNRNNTLNSSSPFGRRHFPRDSGCYEGSPVPVLQQNVQNIIPNESNNLDDVVSQCSNEILKRVETARRLKEDKCPTNKNVNRVAKKGLLGGSGGVSGGIGASVGDESLCSSRGSGGGALSEKSSDSGVSSSSLSSGPAKNNL